ncbi:MAG: hemerythrin domain-containing protein [Planctomycetota bacterium]
MQDHDLATAMMLLHDDLAQSFHRHQISLLDRAFERAAQELASYRDHLFAHARDEEDHVLPRYRELGGDATDAPVRLFAGEHDKLRAFVDDFVTRVDALRQQPSDADLLVLLDREATFKNLVLHHDLRERNMLYPFLAERLGAADQRAILAARRFAGAPAPGDRAERGI